MGHDKIRVEILFHVTFFCNEKKVKKKREREREQMVLTSSRHTQFNYTRQILQEKLRRALCKTVYS